MATTRIIQDSVDLIGKYVRTRSHSDKTNRVFLMKLFDDESYVSRLIEHFEVLDRIFPGNWDYDLTSLIAKQRHGSVEPADTYHTNIHTFSVAKFRFLIHFPEITIRNEEEGTIDIKDLFISMDYSKEGNHWRFKEIKGTRTTMTHGQWNSGYLHSHIPSLSTSSLPDFRNFCTGSSSLAKMITALASDRNYTIQAFQMMALHIRQLAGMESLNGGPHIRLRNITETTYQKLNYSGFSNFAYAWNNLKNISTWPELTAVIENNSIVFTNPQELEEILMANLNDSYKCYLINREYYQLNTIRGYANPDTLQNKPLFWYKGKVQSYTIEPPVTAIDGPPVKVVYPNIVKYVQTKLQTRATRNYHTSYITSDGIRSSALSKNNRPVLQSINAPLQED